LSTKDLKALERHFVEEWNKGKTTAMAAVDKMGATNSIFHTATGEDIHGLENVRQMFSDFYDTFPDNHMTLEDMVAEGDRLALRYTISGTHRDTHKRMTMSAIEICRIVDGKFVECWQAHVSP
jgi:predicted ester cyclase